MNTEQQNNSGLSSVEKKALLQMARNSITRALLDVTVTDPVIDSPVMAENRGAFVTLHNKGQLRGCIGYVLPILPLAETVEEMAQAAALRDTRFPPVKPGEIDELDIEISVLTPMRRIESVDDIEVGVHGLYLKKGYASGLLLPQVAAEYDWDRQTFLEQTCRKAGLPPEAWKDDDTTVHTFSAEVFRESEFEKE